MDGGGNAPLVRIVVPGAPKGKARPRATVIHGHARVYTPKATASEEGAIRLFASQQMQGASPWEGPIDLRIAAYMPIPASWSNGKKCMAVAGGIMPTGRPDIDNIQKLVCDGLNNVVFRDDSQVVSFSGWKRYSAEPRIVIEVRRA